MNDDSHATNDASHGRRGLTHAMVRARKRGRVERSLFVDDEAENEDEVEDDEDDEEDVQNAQNAHMDDFIVSDAPEDEEGEGGLHPGQIMQDDDEDEPQGHQPTPPGDPVVSSPPPPVSEEEDDEPIRFRRELGGEEGLVDFGGMLKAMTNEEIRRYAMLADEALAKASMADILADVLDLANRADAPLGKSALMAACFSRVDTADMSLYAHVDARYVRALSRITNLCGQVDERIMEDLKPCMNQCIWRMFSTAECVSCAIKGVLPPEDLKSLPSLISRVLSLPKQLNDFQCLILVLTMRWSTQGLRKGSDPTDTGVYQRAMTPEGHDTHFWTKICTVEQWVNKECTLGRTASWGLASKDGGVRKRVADWITESAETDFPVRPRDRHVFAFRNGIYKCDTDEFFAYPATGLSQDVGACRYFDNVDMDETLFEDDGFKGEFDDGEWFDIPSDAIDKILNDQGFPEDVQRPYWALAVGRMLYNLREMDRFEVMIFLKGIAGSGKSTLVHILEHIYGLDAGVLSNNIEPLFGLSQLKEKYVIISYELNDKFSLTQSEWLSLVSGETMALAEKHKYASRVPWTSPFLAAGNRLFCQADNASQITRRLILFPFDNKPTGKLDPRMEERISQNIGRVIVKGNRAYHSLVRKASDGALIDFLPEWFTECRRRAQESSNPLYTFLNNVSWVEVDLEHNYTPWEEFQKRFNDWNRQRDPRSRIVFEEDFYKHVFTEFKLKLVFQKVWKVYPLDQEGADRPTKKKAFWLYGVDFANENAVPPNSD